MQRLGFPIAVARFFRKLLVGGGASGPKFYARIAKQTKIPAKSPLVSVIIPCYNYGKFLTDSLESILNQSWRRLEIIIIDDGSTDADTKKLLEKISTTTYPVPVKVIRQQNMGIVSARNNAISKAVGKYIVALDADDKLEASYIEKCVWVLETNPQIGVVYPDLRMFDKKNDIYRFGEFGIKQLREWNQVATTAMFRKEAWSETDGYKQIMKKGHEDWEFWLSIAEKGWEGKHIKEPLMLYRVHSNDSLSNEAFRINANLVSRIKELHPDSLETINSRYPRKYEKPGVNLSHFNFDHKKNDKVILMFAPIVVGGGAERLWTNYAAIMVKKGL
jgi:glycosyltransferase involved in cell wall biosynthesis